jgi:integrase
LRQIAHEAVAGDVQALVEVEAVRGMAHSQTNFRKQQCIPMLTKARLPYIRPHDLRHTAATLLRLEGVQPLVVSEMLGHASVAATLATYGHVQTEMRKPARDPMECLCGAVFEG